MDIYRNIIDSIFPNYEKPEEFRFLKFFSENKNIRHIDRKLQLNGH